SSMTSINQLKEIIDADINVFYSKENAQSSEKIEKKNNEYNYYNILILSTSDSIL
ncbi:hypothetical protein BDBG_17548, partial [Blastomyces gilchristii SLH14081]